MFGIDDALIWGPLIGSAIGGLTNKKNPMEGALLGAGLGLAGGAAAPGLLGAGAGAVPATAAPVFDAVPVAAGSGGTSALTQVAAQGQALPVSGALSGLKSAMGYAKPVGEAMQAANAAKGLLAPAPMTVQSGLPQRIPTDFGGLLAQGGLGELQQKRLARRGMA